MTLVMVWREMDVNRVWIVSDSRLSKRGEVGQIRLTDRAAKILEAQLILHSPAPNLPPLRSNILGFAYIGSSLVALQAYSAVLPLWARLQSSGPQVLPTVGECAEHLGKFVGAYSHEVASSGGDANCQCILLGHDEGADLLATWLIQTERRDSAMNAKVRQIPLAPGAMEMFGSGKSEAERTLEAMKPQSSGWKREPLDMIRRSLKANTQDDVGGGVQIGILFASGFELCFDVQPFTFGVSHFGDPFVAMKYRGFEFSEIGRVGSAFVTLRGIGH